MLTRLAKGVLSAFPQISQAARLVRKTLFGNRLTIFSYHLITDAPYPFFDWCMVDVSAFQDQLSYLARHFALLPLREGVQRCLSDQIDSPAAAITFDDGYQNNYTTAFPVLREMSIPATVFLTTAFIDSNETPWFGRLNDALARTTQQQLVWRGRKLPIQSATDKTRTARHLHSSLKKLPHATLLEEVDALVNSVGPCRPSPDEATSPYQILDSASIREMRDSGLISFGAHTHSHAILSLLSRTEQEDQISKSLEAVEAVTEEPCRVFAYPNGGGRDYNRDTVKLLGRHGVDIAVTAIPGFNKPDSRPLELRRIGIGGNWDTGLFQFMAHTALG